MQLTRTIRPGERRDTLGAFLTLFVMMAGYAMLETARDALFLERIPVSRLPWVYLGIALLSLLVVLVQRQIPLLGRGRGHLSLSLLAAAGITFGLWRYGASGHTRAIYALYIWTGIVGSLVLYRFWSLLEERFTVIQAKRLFAFIGTGSVLGTIFGSALARIVAGAMATDKLLPGAAALFLAASAGSWLLAPARTAPARAPEASRDPLVGAGAELWRSRYLRHFAALLLVSSLALTVADYVFKSLVAAKVPAADLGTFLAGFYLILGLLSLLVQVLAAGWILRVHGVSRALGLLPVALLAGATGIAFGGGLAAALLLKSADGALRNSIHRTAVEVLYLPLAAIQRRRFKVVLDVLGHRGGQALGSVVILATLVLHAPPAVLGVLLMALVVAWAFLADTLQGHYLELFRRTLRDNLGRERESDHGFDLAALESLVSALSSQDDSVVTAALDQLARRRRARLIPLLILYHPSSRVILHALRIFNDARREDVDPLARRLLEHADPEVRAAALRWLASASDAREVLGRALGDPAPLVRATARVMLGALAGEPDRSAIAAIADVAKHGEPLDRMAIAQALEHHPAPAFADVMLVLAQDALPGVRARIANAMKQMPEPRFLPALFAMLANRDLRWPVRRALEAQGAAAIEVGGRLLADPTVAAPVRRQIPRALRRVEPRERAAGLLLGRLLEESDGAIRYRILRSLGSMRRRDPELPLDPVRLEEAIAHTLSIAYRNLNWRFDLERAAREVRERATPTHEMIVKLLVYREQHTIERLLRLLGLQMPGENLRALHRGTLSPDPVVRAGAVELLSNLLAPPVREAMLGLLDEGDPQSRLRAAGPFHRPARDVYSFVLHQMLRHGGPALAAMAARHIGELGLREMRGELRRLEGEASPLVRVVVARSLAALNQAEPEALARGPA